MFSRGVKAYNDVGVTTAVSTANPVQLVVLLYDGAMTALMTAKGEIANQNIPEKNRLIVKALSIIEGLRAAIDYKHGGEIAEQLNDLYLYMIMQLTQANLKNDPDILDEVFRLLAELRGAWDELANNPSTQEGMQEALQARAGEAS